MGLIVALGFLTALPMPRAGEGSPVALARSVGYFPLVGALLGGALVGLDRLLAPLLPLGVRSALLVGAAVVLTRGLHLDGLMDSCDGLFGGFTPERRLAIMRDPRAGTFGVVAVSLLLILKVAALGALAPELRTAGLVLAPCLGRWAIVQATWLFPYGRKEGLGRGFKDEMRWIHALLAGASAALVAGWLGAGFGLGVFAGVSLGVLVLGSVVSARLGGLTGDTYGALCELTEVTVWLLFGLRVGLAAP